MSPNALKLCGLCLILGGVLTAAMMLLHPNDTIDPNAITSPLWAPVHLGLGLAILLGMFGFIGIYSKQSAKAGMLGFVGGAFTIASFALLSGIVSFFEGALIPVIASSSAAQSLLAPDGPLLSGLAGQVLMAVSVLAALGIVINVIALLKAKVFPKLASVLLLGIVLTIFVPPVPFEAGVAGAVLFGISCIWLGYTIWSSKK